MPKRSLPRTRGRRFAIPWPLTISREAPEVVVAVAIAAAAVAYMANVDMPEIAKKIDLAKGLTAESKLDIGKVQQLTVQQAKLALSYTSTHFSAGVSGAYAGEGDNKAARAKRMRPSAARSSSSKARGEGEPGRFGETGSRPGD